MRRNRYLDFILLCKRLNNIKRYSVFNKFCSQSVSEHTFLMTIIAMQLGEIERGLGKKLDMAKLLICSLFHDIPESISGDIIYDFKISKKGFIKEIENMEIKEIKNKLKNFKFLESFVHLYSKCKDNSLEGQIVSIADVIEPYFYVSDEIKMGNKEFNKIKKVCIKIIKKCNLESVKIFFKEICEI